MSKNKTRKNGKKGSAFSRIIKILTILILLGLIIFFFVLTDEQKQKLFGKIEKTKAEMVEVEKPKLKIIDEDSKTRPIAVVYDNNVDAWSHSGISNAYAVYEFPVEGGESRVLAFYKDKKDIVVGPIRSARHYFLDYVLEHDAIFAHLGKSPKAESDMGTLRISNINGQEYDTGMQRANLPMEYWRVNTKYSPHNAYTDLTNLQNIMENKGYKSETSTKVPFKYSVIEKDLEKDKSKKISSLMGWYHIGNKTVFNYDEETKMYTKTSKGILQNDELTGKPLEYKNIVILETSVTQLPDSEKKDRKEVQTVGTLNGIYSSNGRVMKIKAKKDSRAAQTKYMDEEGNEIVFNDGVTFVMIVPNLDPAGYDYVEVPEEVTENIN